MKRRVIAAFIALLLCLTLLPTASLADGDKLTIDYSTQPEVTKLQICQEGNDFILKMKIRNPSSVRENIDLLSFLGKDHYISGLQMMYSLNGGSWELADITIEGNDSKWNGTWYTGPISGLKSDSWVRACARYTGVDDDGNPVLSDWSEVLVVNEENAGEPEPPFEFNAHDWAKPELTEADGAGLIPADLRSADLKAPITRAEFAAVSVKVYEALSGLKADPAAVNPFTDTADLEVLKALNVGVTNGVSDTEFAPSSLLNREQAATMLSRVYKKVAFAGWTLTTDGDYADAFRALFTMPEPFADDADISSWAKDSVYFMASKGIIKGIGDNLFGPRAVTAEQQASGYAQATREQAILIAVRLVKNLSGS